MNVFIYTHPSGVVNRNVKKGNIKAPGLLRRISVIIISVFHHYTASISGPPVPLVIRKCDSSSAKVTNKSVFHGAGFSVTLQIINGACPGDLLNVA